MRHRIARSAAGELGFTLLEMVIALTLVAMMAVGLWALFRVSIASWQRGSDYIDINQRHRSILDLVKKQMGSIHGLVAPVDLQAGGAIYPIFVGVEGSCQFVSLNSLRFQENPGLTMVSYDVVRNREGSYALVEREEQYLGLDPNRESIFDNRDERVITIFDNLASFLFEYYDPGTSSRPPRWVREWNGRDLGRLPAAISMTMIAQDDRGGTLSRHLVIPIMAKPYDPRLSFANPFDPRPRRLGQQQETEP